jgi:class 3 adenylate cyclase
MYYGTFLNEMVNVAKDFGGYTFKTGGDEVIVIFPESGCFAHTDGAILCGLMMIEVIKKVVSPFLQAQRLPSLKCRVSADHGTATIVEVEGIVPPFELVGNFMNYAGKFLKFAEENGMVIGENLFKLIHTDYRIACRLKGRLSDYGDYKYYSVDYELP